MFITDDSTAYKIAGSKSDAVHSIRSVLFRQQSSVFQLTVRHVASPAAFNMRVFCPVLTRTGAPPSPIFEYPAAV
jgi:hypothetical protein